VPGTKSTEQSDETLSAINILGKERKGKEKKNVITDILVINLRDFYGKIQEFVA